MKKTTQKTVTAATKIAGFADAKRIVRKLGWKNHQAYSWAKIEGRLPSALPQNPKEVYARYWKGWDNFFGLTK